LEKVIILLLIGVCFNYLLFPFPLLPGDVSDEAVEEPSRGSSVGGSPDSPVSILYNTLAE
jgi:hypothetical protein